MCEKAKMRPGEFSESFKSYPAMSAILKTYGYAEILEQAANLAGLTPENLAVCQIDCSLRGTTHNIYHFLLQDLLKNTAHYDWLYDHLANDLSRRVFTYLIAYRLFPARQFLKSASDICVPLSYNGELDRGEMLTIDTEGSAAPALLEVKKRIRDEFPPIEIYVHQCISDLWEIPKLINAIYPEYCFFIRQYNSADNYKTILYAIPPERSDRSGCAFIPRKRRNVVSIHAISGWYNEDLLKDCGVIPYLLYKNHHCNAKLVGSRRMDQYTNLQYVEGLQLEFLKDDTLQTKLSYLEENADAIDCLLFYGCYEHYFPMADIYKSQNPNGRICLALDANSRWMDRMQWTELDFQDFMNRCDVITVAGHTMQKHLNKKWPWAIECIPNGFYNFSAKQWEIDYKKKKNIILTVGRLGTKQKATHILLEAFAQIAGCIPDWELHLVGSVEREFEVYIEQFFERFPDLKVRVHFIGRIDDRDLLYKVYQEAKIFSLPSCFEGGTPNVLAEALHAGNVIAVAKIDEYQDATDCGKCGMAAEINDVSNFAEILLKLCRCEYLETMCRHAHDYAKSNFDMEKIVARLNYLIFGEGD